MATGRPSHRSPKQPYSTRKRYLWALTGLPVVAAAGLYVAMAPGATSAQTQDHITVPGPSKAHTTPGSVTEVQAASQCTSQGGTTTGTGKSAACSVGAMGIAKMPAHHPYRPHPKPSATSAPASASASPSSPGSTTPSSSAPTTGSTGTSPSQQGTPADQVLALINQARSQNGLPALTFSSGLNTSASQHNLLMAQGCGLSHQCAGEPAIGDRETAAGVHWTSAGENIGEEGPISDDTSEIAQAAVALTQDMLNEQPPNDGHRKNILSSSFTHIGIAVYRDSSGTVWLTQDFSN
ncbi:MAG TPA: CAP domain-containing protein [Streptosporangiaceae bacterium]|nr:CAP domain-containing protein [Streptosporangiaceae bacterium]